MGPWTSKPVAKSSPNPSTAVPGLSQDQLSRLRQASSPEDIATISLVTMKDTQSDCKEAMLKLDSKIALLPKDKRESIKSCMKEFLLIIQETQRYSSQMKRVLKLQLSAIQSLKQLRHGAGSPGASDVFTDVKLRLEDAKIQSVKLSAVCQNLIAKYEQMSGSLKGLGESLQGYADSQLCLCKWHVGVSVLAGLLTLGCIALCVYTAPAVIAAVLAKTVLDEIAVVVVFGASAVAMPSSGHKAWKAGKQASAAAVLTEKGLVAQEFVERLKTINRNVADVHSNLIKLTMGFEDVDGMSEDFIKHDLRVLANLEDSPNFWGNLQDYEASLDRMSKELLELDELSRESWTVMGRTETYVHALG